jgi:hypothetical protein
VPGALSLKVKGTGHSADYSLPSSAEVKNEWSYCLHCLHGMDRENFLLTYGKIFFALSEYIILS